MTNPWEMWKRGFEVWEKSTAHYMEHVLRNPTVLGPAGTLVTGAAKVKSLSDKASARWWRAMGLSTKHDQERSLHALNQIQSQLYDLQERLDDLESRKPRDGR